MARSISKELTIPDMPLRKHDMMLKVDRCELTRRKSEPFFRFFCTLSPGNIAPTLFFSALSGESEPICREIEALSRGRLLLRLSQPFSGNYTIPHPHFRGKGFHVILEQSAHDNFEHIDNQVINKTSAHFGRLKLSKCAPKFFAY